jgi:hypothetical protein
MFKIGDKVKVISARNREHFTKVSTIIQVSLSGTLNTLYQLKDINNVGFYERELMLLEKRKPIREEDLIL